MSGAMFQWLQGVVLGALLVFSVYTAWRRLLPRHSRRVLSKLARALDRPGRGAVGRWLGRRLQPAEAARGSCGDGGGCSACSGCAPVRPVQREVQAVPITIHPRRPH